jgi:hypothetical protein
MSFEKYDKLLISIFDIIGSYFVDLYYNTVYQKAHNYSLEGAKSFTDQYIELVKKIAISIQNDEGTYHKIIKNLHQVFIHSTRYSTITFAQFVDKVTEQLIPSDYFDSTTMYNRDEVLGNAICFLNLRLAINITSPAMLRRIIDKRDDDYEITIKMLRNFAIQSLLLKRDEVRNQFLKQIGKVETTEMSETTMELIEKNHTLETAVNSFKIEKKQMQQKIRDMVIQIDNLNEELDKYKKLTLAFKDMIKKLQLRSIPSSRLPPSVDGSRMPPRLPPSVASASPSTDDPRYHPPSVASPSRLPPSIDDSRYHRVMPDDEPKYHQVSPDDVELITPVEETRPRQPQSAPAASSDETRPRQPQSAPAASSDETKARQPHSAPAASSDETKARQPHSAPWTLPTPVEGPPTDDGASHLYPSSGEFEQNLISTGGDEGGDDGDDGEGDDGDETTEEVEVIGDPNAPTPSDDEGETTTSAQQFHAVVSDKLAKLAKMIDNKETE